MMLGKVGIPFALRRYPLLKTAGFAAAVLLSSTVLAPQFRAFADPAPVAATVAGPLTPLQLDSIHNALQWSLNIISGSCPDAEAGYKALAARGVKTIVTVDGAQPDVAVAKKYGLRYVHIPVEYSGIAHEDALKIIRAVRDLPGPVFIHCHHGKHRGPAAAAIVAITLANYSNDQAAAALKQSGTGENYKGLWALVKGFKPPTKDELDKADKTFPEKATMGGTVGAMISIDNRFDGMKAIKGAGWKSTPEHPDLDAAHEALLLREAFRELARLPQTAKYPADYADMIAKSEAAAADMEAAIRAGDSAKATAAFTTIQANCGSCHKVYRDNIPVN